MRHLTELDCPPRRLIAEKGNRLYFLEPRVIEYIESNGNYMTLHTAADKFVMRHTLKSLAAAVKPLGFMRIDRSTLLNIAQVAFAERIDKGRFAFTLRSGGQVVSCSAYRRTILAELHNDFGFSGAELENALSFDQTALGGTRTAELS